MDFWGAIPPGTYASPNGISVTVRFTDGLRNLLEITPASPLTGHIRVKYIFDDETLFATELSIDESYGAKFAGLGVSLVSMSTSAEEVKIKIGQSEFIYDLDNISDLLGDLDFAEVPLSDAIQFYEDIADALELRGNVGDEYLGVAMEQAPNVADLTTHDSAADVNMENSTFSLDSYDEVLNFGCVEVVLGTAYGDTVIGDGDDNRLEGRGGADTLFGGGGNDIIQGGADSDTIDGGAGHDLIFGGQYDAGGSNSFGIYSTYNDTLNGGSGDDILIASGGPNTLNGGAGSDLLISRGGSDTLIGGSASDLIIVEAGSSDSVTIDGGSGDDFIFAGNSSSGSDITVMFGADSGHDYIAAGGSKVDEIVFEGLSGSDVRLFWNYHVVSTEGSLAVPVDFDPYEPTVFLSETEHRAGQAYIQVKSTGATINLGHMEGTYVTNKGVEFYDDACPGEQDWGFSFTYNTSISMAKELTLTFDDGSFTGGPQDGLPGFPPFYYSLVSSSADDDGTVSDNGLISVDDFIHGSLGNGGGGTAFLESFSNNAIGNSGALLNGETDLDVILSASTIALLEQDIFAV